jgi:hypothetical protein
MLKRCVIILNSMHGILFFKELKSVFYNPFISLLNSLYYILTQYVILLYNMYKTIILKKSIYIIYKYYVVIF